MLSQGRKYIPPCQSRFARQAAPFELAKLQYDNISNTVKNCLTCHQMSTTDERAKQAFAELENMIYNCYTKSIPSRLYRRARREHRRIKRLQRWLRSRPDIIVRRIDKSEGFYFGSTAAMNQKTEEYMKTTEAYQEVVDGHSPLIEILHATEILLDYLVEKKAITKARRDKLLPDKNIMELAHLYTNPKVHKVIFVHRFVCFLFLFMETNC